MSIDDFLATQEERRRREQAGPACEAKARSSRQVPQRGGGTMSAQIARPTPGPYTIRERSGGVEVRGAHGVSVAWFYESCTVGTDGSHSISTDEARANAEAFVAALEGRRCRGCGVQLVQEDQRAKGPPMTEPAPDLARAEAAERARCQAEQPARDVGELLTCIEELADSLDSARAIIMAEADGDEDDDRVEGERINEALALVAKYRSGEDGR